MAFLRSRGTPALPDYVDPESDSFSLTATRALHRSFLESLKVTFRVQTMIDSFPAFWPDHFRFSISGRFFHPAASGAFIPEQRLFIGREAEAPQVAQCKFCRSVCRHLVLFSGLLLTYFRLLQGSQSAGGQEPAPKRGASTAGASSSEAPDVAKAGKKKAKGGPPPLMDEVAAAGRAKVLDVATLLPVCE